MDQQTEQEPDQGATGESAINDALDAAVPLGPHLGGGDVEPVAPLQRADHPLNDYGNAMRLLGQYGRNVLFVESMGWLYWDGKRWTTDGAKQAIMRMCHDTAMSIRDEAGALSTRGQELAEEDDRRWPAPGIKRTPTQREDFAPDLLAVSDRVERLHKFAVSSGNDGKVKAMPANAEAYVRVAVDEIDRHFDRFTVMNGTLMLDHAAVLDDDPDCAVRLDPFSRDARMTRCAPVHYDPNANAPQWHAFLESILPDPEVRQFLQRFAGYLLTGETSEQVMVVFYGTGANGKSTMIETLGDVMGDYRESVPIATFLHDDRAGGGDATPDIAKLPGARLVLASEPEVGDRLSESRVKTITGGERISARHLFKDMFEFVPQFKLVLCVNTRPNIRGADEGIWRRVLMVPFDQVIPPEKRDKHLRRKLMAETSGILNWMLDGWRMWAEDGLKVPDVVKQATENYRADSDQVAAFLSDCTRRIEGATVNAKALYQAYCFYIREDQGGEPMTQNKFGRSMSDKGIRKEKVGTMFYQGLELLDDIQARMRKRDEDEGSI